METAQTLSRDVPLRHDPHLQDHGPGNMRWQVCLTCCLLYQCSQKLWCMKPSPDWRVLGPKHSPIWPRRRPSCWPRCLKQQSLEIKKTHLYKRRDYTILGWVWWDFLSPIEPTLYKRLFYTWVGLMGLTILLCHGTNKSLVPSDPPYIREENILYWICEISKLQNELLGIISQ